MGELEDFEIQKSQEMASEDEPTSPTLPVSRPTGYRWAGVVLGLIAAIIVVAVFALRARRAATPSPTPAPVEMSRASSPSPSAPATTLPRLDDSDVLVRDLLRGASSHALLAIWLGRPALIRTAVGIVDNLASGESPAPHLSFLAPKQPFQVVKERGRIWIDPQSYARWDGVAEAIASLDAKTVARAIQLLEPLLDAAYRELGHPEGGFRRALQSSLSSLAQTRVPEGDLAVVRVVRSVVVYEYADQRLESLPAIDKQLLRFGPRNAAAVQAKLRELADALGPVPKGAE